LPLVSRARSQYISSGAVVDTHVSATVPRSLGSGSRGDGGGGVKARGSRTNKRRDGWPTS